MTSIAGMFDRILGLAASAGASDVHLTADRPPAMRRDGRLEPIPGSPETLTAAWVEAALAELMSAAQREEFRTRGEVDLASVVSGVGRVRVSVFRQRGTTAAALRLIPDRIVALADLGAPDVATELALRRQGLVLVTGPSGSGKSTTLAAMIQHISTTLAVHIITIEDPIEFLHPSGSSLVHQREIGADSGSFAEALRRVLRQDPDVVLIGELRDPESISTALTAAETGHLVLSTLHTQSAAKSLNRIVDAYPSDRHEQIRGQLGDTLQGVISQSLVPLAHGPGRALATEVLINTPAVAHLIRGGDVSQLTSTMQAGHAVGMHTLDQDLARLLAEGALSIDAARGVAADPRSLEDIRPRATDPDGWWPGAAVPARPRDGAR